MKPPSANPPSSNPRSTQPQSTRPQSTSASVDANAIWNAGLDAVRARPLVARSVRWDAGQLWLGEHCVDVSDVERIVVVGAGKATTAMAMGLLDSLGDRLPIVGWVNVPEGTESDLPGVHVHAGRPAGLNEPTPEGVFGTQQILQMVEQAGPGDLCIALISGGGSALLPAPVDGVSLEDKVAVSRLLSGAGADITELNLVRKHLSRVKGGGLLRACRAGQLVSLVLSDVLGDPLDLIASGPTMIDTSTPDQALRTLLRFDPDQQAPSSIYETLRSGRIKNDPVTTRVTHQILGNNAVAVDEAGIKAESLGLNHIMQSATQSEGTAEDMGCRIAAMTVEMLRADPNEHPVNCLISGGEPTVKLVDSERRGKGGRNQQLVLAAYEYLLKAQLSESEWERICVLSGGTDGEDGPTDAAGACLDANVHNRAIEQSLRPEDYLCRNDAYHFFAATGGLLMTGPTGTNVCDVRVALVK